MILTRSSILRKRQQPPINIVDDIIHCKKYSKKNNEEQVTENTQIVDKEENTQIIDKEEDKRLSRPVLPSGGTHNRTRYG